MWSEVRCKFKYSFSGNGFLGFCLKWTKNTVPCIIVNIHSSCNITQKRIWEDLLMSKKGFGGPLWCVVGDFNVVKKRRKRKGWGMTGMQQEVQNSRTS